MQVELLLELRFEGDHNTGVKAHVFVHLNGGWHSKGSEVHYSEFPEISSNPELTGLPDGGSIYISGGYHDLYKRGIKFRFTYGGTISTFDIFHLVTSVTSTLVLVGVSGTLVSMVAFNLLGYKSTLYKDASDEKFKVKHLHARRATEAVVASVVFRQLQGQHESLTRGVLVKVCVQ